MEREIRLGLSVDSFHLGMSVVEVLDALREKSTGRDIVIRTETSGVMEDAETMHGMRLFSITHVPSSLTLFFETFRQRLVAIEVGFDGEGETCRLGSGSRLAVLCGAGEHPSVSNVNACLGPTRAGSVINGHVTMSFDGLCVVLANKAGETPPSADSRIVPEGEEKVERLIVFDGSDIRSLMPWTSKDEGAPWRWIHGHWESRADLEMPRYPSPCSADTLILLGGDTKCSKIVFPKCVVPLQLSTCSLEDCCSILGAPTTTKTIVRNNLTIFFYKSLGAELRFHQKSATEPNTLHAVTLYTNRLDHPRAGMQHKNVFWCVGKEEGKMTHCDVEWTEEVAERFFRVEEEPALVYPPKKSPFAPSLQYKFRHGNIEVYGSRIASITLLN